MGNKETSQNTQQQDFVSNSMEAIIRIALVGLVLYMCLNTIKPFFMPLLWGLIIAVSLYPVHKFFMARLKLSNGWSAFVITVIALGVMLIPAITFSSRAFQNLKALSEKFNAGYNIVPAPNPSVADWPLIGSKIYPLWQDAYQNLETVMVDYKDEIASFGETLLGTLGDTGVGLFQVIAAIIIAGFVIANGEACNNFATRLMTRLVGEKGEEYATLTGQTVSGVTRGILGVSIVQSGLGLLGFMVMDVPGAALWALLVLIMGIINAGPTLVFIGVGIYMLGVIDSTLVGIAFLIWNVAIGLLDNVLKPIFMGRGINVPTVIIFLGAIGGFMASGIIGLFTGAVILVIGYSLFTAWMDSETDKQ